MADDFEKAVLITFNYGGNIDPSLKERAAAYVAGIKQSSDCWKLCVERFGTTMYPEVKFWCLQTLHEVIMACYQQLDAAAQQAIKGSLLAWLQRDCTTEAPPLPPFLRNKLAQALVGVVRAEYPAVWPNFFRELCAAASSGPGLADMFARIMVSVDEDIISLEIPRSAEETKLSMHVKDSLRESCISEVAATWYSLTQMYRASRPDLAAFVLGSCARYVHWMDIGLVANDKFIPLLGELLDCPHNALRCAATDVLIEVVSKRMEPTSKVSLVQQLKVVEACERLSSNLVMAAGASKAAAAAAGGRGAGGGNAGSSGAGGGMGAAGQQQQQQLAQDEELLAKYAKLLATLAGEVMDALKRIENVVISFTTLGLGVNEEANREASSAAQAANQLLDSLTRSSLNAFSSGLPVISMPLLPFISGYVSRLRALVKRGEALPASAQAHLQAVFEGVAAAARYPDNGANEDDEYSGVASSNGSNCSSASIAACSGLASTSSGGSARMSDASYQAAREEQYDVEEQRKELLSLFKNAAKLAFPDALRFVAAKVQSVLAAAAAAAGSSTGPNGLCSSSAAAGGGGGSSSKGSTPDGRRFQDTELAVTLVYELGEGAPEESLKPGSGGLAQLVMLLLDQAAALPAGKHRLVALAVLETCVRYCRLLQQHQESIPGGLGLFLGPRGLGHPSPTVATRAAYLLCRIVKFLRSNLRQYVGTLLQQLQPYLEVVATRPPPSNTAAVGSSREAAAGRAAVTAVLVDDRLYVFEAVGLLLGQEELPADQQLAAVQQLLQPLVQQLEANLRPAVAEAAAGGGGSSGGSSWAIVQSLEAIARINKGFKHELCTGSRPQLGAAFMSCLEVSLAVPQQLPGNKQLRARFIAFLHRMVECLMANVLSYLPAALEALMGPTADAVDMSDVMQLLVQLVLRFKEDLAKLVQAALPVAVVKVHTLLGPDWDWSGKAASPAAAAAAAAQSSPQQQQQQQPQQVAATLEDMREKGELQRSYYSLLLGLSSNNLVGSLLQLPPQVLDNIMNAVARGAATHVDPAVRRICIQVFERLLSEWCPAGANELVPGFRAYAVQQLGGQACVLGLLGNPTAAAAAAAAGAANGLPVGASSPGLLDARDAATVTLLSEVASALKLLHERCGDELVAHLCSSVLPASGLPLELQQQLVLHVRDSDLRRLKEFLREVLLAARAGGK